MNILLVHNYYQLPGGEDTVVAAEAELLRSHGHHVVLYTRHNSELEGFSRLQKLTLPLTFLYNPRTYREIRRIIKKEHIDIVHVHNTLMLISPAVYYAARSRKIPVVQTLHNFRLLCPGATFFRDGAVCEDCLTEGLGCAVKHRCYRGSKAQTLACVISTKFHRMTGIYKKLNYICLTEFNRRKLLTLKGIQPDRVAVKPNFVIQTEGLVPQEDRADRIIFAGRLEELKGLRVLLESWRLLGPDAPRLVICGTGPLEEKCLAFVKENKMRNVTLAGKLPNENLRRLLSTSKALILPTQCYEGFPMCIAEAFSVGTPVLVSDLGNGGNLITQGRTGMKFNQKSPQSIASTVSTFLADQDTDWQKYTREAYLKTMTPEGNYERLMEIYAQAAQRR